MLRLLTIIVLSINIYACALCALYTPTAHVSFKGNSISWEFSSNFSQTLLDGYDTNNDKTLDENELIKVKAALLDYLLPRKFLTTLKYYDLPFGESIDIKFILKDVKVSFDKELVLEYFIDYDFTPKIDRVLVLSVEDLDGFFNFKIKENSYQVKDFSINENINLNAVYYEFKAPTFTQATTTKIEEKSKEFETGISIYENMLKFLATLQSKMISLLKDNSLLLYPIALIYGFLHALLPSHGKSITAAYFMNSKKQILFFSLKVGFIHLINAFIIAGFFSIFSLFNLSKISGFLISLLACILLYLKLSKKQSVNIVEKPNNIKSFKLANNSKILKVVKNEKALDNFLAFSIGLLPCPGLILVIGFIQSLGAVAFIAAILIALGMSLAIFLSAFIVTRFKFSKKLEIISLIFVIFVGLYIGFFQ